MQASSTTQEGLTDPCDSEKLPDLKDELISASYNCT